MKNMRVISWVWVGSAGIWALLAAANILLGELNQDEGWYLYAARLTAEGYLPFRDYAFTQGPVFPLIYSFLDPIVQRYGILGGRVCTALLGLGAALVAASLARNLAGGGIRGSYAAALAFILIAANVYHSYFTAVVKTYSLTALFLTGSLLLLCMRRFVFAAAFASGTLVVLAAATRSSAAVAAPIVFLYLLSRKEESRTYRVLGFAAGGLTAAIMFLLPFALTAPEGLWFGLFRYHTARYVGSPLHLLAFKAGFLSRLAQGYFVAVVMLIGLAIGILTGVMAKDQNRNPSPLPRSAIWLIVLAISAVHFAAPFPYDDYQVFLFPPTAAVLAAAYAARIRIMTHSQNRSPSGQVVRWMLPTVFLACVCASFSSPVNQSWLIAGRDRIWWKTKTEPDLIRLCRAARLVRELSGGSDLLLTQDCYLAVEARMHVPRGMEMGPFCYFPDWSQERAERLHVLNRDMMLHLLSNCAARVAAFSGYGLSIQAPEIVPLDAEEVELLHRTLQRRYRLHSRIPQFGQAHTTLEIYVLEGSD